MSIGERIKNERKRLGYKQNQLAELLGVVRQTLFQYEKGLRTPDVVVLEKLATLGFDIQYIVTGESGEFALAPEEQKLVSSFRLANPSLKKAALAVLETGLTGGHTVSVKGNANKVNVG